MALENSYGEMYIQRESNIDLMSQPQNVCFVCGSMGCFEQYRLRIGPNSADSTEPFFPFLETHEPPIGYKLDLRSDPTVSSSDLPLFSSLYFVLTNDVLINIQSSLCINIKLGE